MRIVIDFGAIAHVIRRWWWRRVGGERSETQCAGCGREMTRDEAFHYIFHCERCEGIEMEKLDCL